MKTSTNHNRSTRRLPIGAEVTADRTDFRVWAPDAEGVDLVIEGAATSSYRLEAEGEGYFSGLVRSAQPGMRYRYRLNRGDVLLPDLPSRYQPYGPHGSSMIVDPQEFSWTDASWEGVLLKGQVLSEMHIVTFNFTGHPATARMDGDCE